MVESGRKRLKELEQYFKNYSKGKFDEDSSVLDELTKEYEELEKSLKNQTERKLFEEIYQIKKYWSNPELNTVSTAVWGTVMSFMTLLDGDGITGESFHYTLMDGKEKVSSSSFHEKFCKYAGLRMEQEKESLTNLKAEIKRINDGFKELSIAITLKLVLEEDMTYIVDETETLYYGDEIGERMIDRLNDALSKDFEDGYIDCVCPGRWFVTK